MRVVVEELPQRSFSRAYVNSLIKRSNKIFSAIVILVIFPIAILVINTSLFLITKNVVYERNIGISKFYFDFVHKSSETNGSLIDFYSKTLPMKSFYKSPKLFSDMLIKSSKIALGKAKLRQSVGLIARNSLSSGDYNVEELQNGAILEVNSIIEDEGFLDSEIREATKSFLLGKIQAASFFGLPPDTTVLKKYKVILNKLGSILGENEERKYVVIFQDTNGIRPTGGKIVSLAALTFNRGKLVESLLLHPEDVDKKILGKIDPPYPLNQTSKTWSFSEANWPSDMVAAARQVEWFLDHSLGLKFDGVIFVDHNISTNDDLRRVLDDLVKLSTEQRIGVIDNVLQDKNKNILFYFNSEDEMSMAQSVGLSNAISSAECDTCLNDYLGIVESELSIGGYNDAIERKAELNISIQGSIVKKKLRISFSKRTDSNKDYEIYLRLIVPRGFSFSPVTIDDQKYFGEQEVQGGSKELGLIIDFGSEFKQKVLEVALEGTRLLNKNFNNYNFRWISQPGVSNFYSSVGIDLTGSNFSEITSNESLTQSAAGVYNTSLVPFDDNIGINVFYR